MYACDTTDDAEINEYRVKLLGSLLLFTRTFFNIRTGTEFRLSYPTARESHFISICRALTRVLRGETKRLVINLPPRYGKTELLIHFVAWALARYPDSNFIYASYSLSLAATQTEIIRDIMMLPEYQELFGIALSKSTKAKHHFITNSGGRIYAAGLDGSITGRGAGVMGREEFGGAILIDDAHKPAEVHSEVTRESVIDRYKGTLRSRRNNGPDTPVIIIGQRLREDDLPEWLMKEDHEEWETLILPALDVVDNALYPEMHNKDYLLALKESDPYNFAAQYQQNPIPAGGGLFKKAWFPLLQKMPEMLATFITADTAETDKDYNDATVFSFWGLYKPTVSSVEIDTYCLHWIDCWEMRIEPKDLQDEFMQFYLACNRFKVAPSTIAIEAKSTGTTLSSVLSSIPGLNVIKIQRTKASGSKTARFIEMQSYVAQHKISLLEGAKHTEMCINHCAKITANDTHRFDDIADTLYDAVKLALIDKSIQKLYVAPEAEQKQKDVAKGIMAQHNRIKTLRRGQSWPR